MPIFYPGIYMWTEIFHYLLIGIGLYGFASLVADKVESRFNDRLEAIEDKLGI
jgi:hypothetical protein